MQRREKAVTSGEEIDAIIRGAVVCHLAFAVDNMPYQVPVAFGYDGKDLYFHTSLAGRKIEFLEAGNVVCFEFERNVKLVTHPEKACAWSFSYESVIGYGHVEELIDPFCKQAGLQQIMRQYSGRHWEIEEAGMRVTRVWRIRIDSMTGKRSGPKQD